jgi:hypothetical protein
VPLKYTLVANVGTLAAEQDAREAYRLKRWYVDRKGQESRE